MNTYYCLKKSGLNTLGSLFSFSIDTSALKKASEEIVKTFPNETEETYFIPYKSGKSRLRQPAKGKLWSRYVNVRAALRMANQHMTPKESVSQGVSDYSESLLDEENADLTFLKAGVEPYPRVYLAWENTFALRQKLYKNSTIEEIFNSFPCLKMDFSVELVIYCFAYTEFGKSFAPLDSIKLLIYILKHV